MKINTILPEKQPFLRCLKSIDKCPKRLYFIGKIPPARQPTVAIIGTRRPTAYGKEVAHQLAYELASRGVVIVSGLAIGTDGIAHRGALAANGLTLAVLGNGLNTVYPSSHRQLTIDIIAVGGGLLSEYEPSMPALPHQFLERNRIVSGLSDAVIVVEAASRSGTLSTAAHALNQGREVFAVPGNITSPLSAGCNALIKQGATPLTSSQDVFDVVAPQASEPTQTQLILGDNPAEVAIIELLQQGVRDGEELLEQSQLEPVLFTQTLSMLEIKGLITALGANQWMLR